MHKVPNKQHVFLKIKACDLSLQKHLIAPLFTQDVYVAKKLENMWLCKEVYFHTIKLYHRLSTNSNRFRLKSFLDIISL